MIEDETPTHREDDSVADLADSFIALYEAIEDANNTLAPPCGEHGAAYAFNVLSAVQSGEKSMLDTARRLAARREQTAARPAEDDGYTNGVHSCWGQVTSSAECEQDPQGRWHFIDCGVLDSLLAQSAATPPTPAPRRMMGTVGCGAYGGQCPHNGEHDRRGSCGMRHSRAVHRCQPLPEPVERTAVE